MTRAPGWLTDPTGRHEFRYWDGDLWTADVSDGGAMAFDPLEVPVTPPPSDTTWPPSPAPAAGGPPPGDARPIASFPSRVGDPDPIASPPPPGGPDPTRSGGADRSMPSPGTIDPAGPFPPRASTADPTGPVGSARRRSPLLVVALVVVVVALGAALAIALISGSGGDDGGPTSAAGSSRSTSGSGTGEGTSSTSGSGTSTGDGDLMVEAVAEGIVEGSGGAIGQSEAECMGRALIDEIGMDRLAELTEAATGEASVNPLDLLTEAEQTGAMTRMRACVDEATLDDLAPEGE